MTNTINILQQQIIEAQDTSLQGAVELLMALLNKECLTAEGTEKVRLYWTGFKAAQCHIEALQQELETELYGERKRKTERFIDDYTGATQDLIPQYAPLCGYTTVQEKIQSNIEKTN